MRGWFDGLLFLFWARMILVNLLDWFDGFELLLRGWHVVGVACAVVGGILLVLLV